MEQQAVYFVHRSKASCLDVHIYEQQGHPSLTTSCKCNTMQHVSVHTGASFFLPDTCAFSSAGTQNSPLLLNSGLLVFLSSSPHTTLQTKSIQLSPSIPFFSSSTARQLSPPFPGLTMRTFLGQPPKQDRLGNPVIWHTCKITQQLQLPSLDLVTHCFLNTPPLSNPLVGCIFQGYL